MSNNLRIAFRFLTAKKRSMAMSLACTILGVGLFIVTQAATTGIEKLFFRAIVGADGAISIDDKILHTFRTITAEKLSGRTGSTEGLKFIPGIDEPQQVIDALRRFRSITAMSPILRGTVDVDSSFKSENARLIYGIDVDAHLQVSRLDQQIVAGAMADFRATPNGALLGLELANRLELQVGDTFRVEANGTWHSLRVSAIYQTGVSDYDKLRIFVHLGEARALLKRPTGLTLIQLQIEDADRAVEEAQHIAHVIGYTAKPWQVREEVWLGVFKALRMSSGIVVTVFTLIASLAMFNTLAMLVIEKTKDIAILRSMGYERHDITNIFLWLAMIVLAVGSVLGSLFGAVVTWGVSFLPLKLRGIIVTSYYPVEPSPWHYVAAIGTAVVMVMIASIIPARRAARLEPGDIVRGTAQ